MTDILLSSSVLIAALAVLRRALCGKLSPRVMYALWALAALRLLLPFNLGASPISVQNVRAVPSETVQTAPSDAALPETGGETLAPAPEPAAVPAPGLLDGLVSAAGRAPGRQRLGACPRAVSCRLVVRPARVARRRALPAGR